MQSERRTFIKCYNRPRIFKFQFLFYRIVQLENQYSKQLKTVKVDVSSDESVLSAAKEISRETDYLNLLINNAGIAKDRSETILDTMYYDDMLRLFNVNSLGTLRVTKSVINLLLKGEPKLLVNISSAAASVGTVTRKLQTKASVCSGYISSLFFHF